MTPDILLMISRRKYPAEKYTKKYRARLDEISGIRDPGILWDERVGKIVLSLYRGLISCVTDELYLQEFLPVGEMYRQAGELGVLRRRQGVSLEVVMEEHILFRDVFWEFHREEKRGHDFRVEKRVCQCLNSALQSTLHAYETQDVIMDVFGPIRDPLTGLFNSHYFFLRVGEELNRVERYLRDFTVGVLMVEGIGDGDMRDEALRGSARVLRRNMRASDLASRLDDEKFAVLFPETTREGAEAACERLASMITKYLRDHVQGLGTSSVLTGLASYPVDGEEPVSLVEAAASRLLEGGSGEYIGD